MISANLKEITIKTISSKKEKSILKYWEQILYCKHYTLNLVF